MSVKSASLPYALIQNLSNFHPHEVVGRSGMT